MKTREIHDGKKYTDGKGNVREVVASGPDYILYQGQSDTDCVLYRITERGKRGPAIGTTGNTTRNSFAKWAKSEVA